MTPARRLRHAVVLAALLAIGCGGDDAEARPRLYAAASVTRAVDDLPAAGAPPFTPVLGATSLLVRQLRSGAAPGVLIAADAVWADALESDGLVEPGTRVDLLGNRLVVIAAAHVEVVPSSVADLVWQGPGRVALAETEHVPAGRYARAALEAAGVWDAVRPRVIETSDVRAAVTLVARGEADLGIVYASDATSASVRVAFDVPGELHPRIVYPLLLCRDAPPSARGLWQWLQRPEAARVFSAAGLRPLAR